MSKCNSGIIIKKRLKGLYFSCQLEKIEWWDELPVIEDIGEGGIKE